MFAHETLQKNFSELKYLIIKKYLQTKIKVININTNEKFINLLFK